MNDTDVHATNTDYKTKLHKHYKLVLQIWLVNNNVVPGSTKMLTQEHVTLGKTRLCVSLCISAGVFKDSFWRLLYTPVGGDAWLSLWVNHWLFHSSDLKSLDSFNNVTPSTVLLCLSSGAVIDTVSVCTSNVIHSWIFSFETVVVPEAIDLMFQTTRI